MSKTTETFNFSHKFPILNGFGFIHTKEETTGNDKKTTFIAEYIDMNGNKNTLVDYVIDEAQTTFNTDLELSLEDQAEKVVTFIIESKLLQILEMEDDC